MAPSADELRKIANEAEADLNTYQAKTGAARGRDIDEAGVDTRVEKGFEGAKVSYEPEQVTNASYDRRIPPEEGGETDDRGRWVTYTLLAVSVIERWHANSIAGILPAAGSKVPEAQKRRWS